MSINWGKRFSWEINYLRVNDNIATVEQEINDAIIIIPTELKEKIRPNFSGYFTFTNDSMYSIRYDTLKINYQKLFFDID